MVTADPCKSETSLPSIMEITPQAASFESADYIGATKGYRLTTISNKSSAVSAETGFRE